MSGVQYPYKYDRGELIWCEKGLGRKLGKRAGSLDSNGYRRVMLNGSYECEHRVIWRMFFGEVPLGYEVDHINYDSKDNRIENLRCLPKKLHKQTRRIKPVRSGTKWRVRSFKGGKSLELGHYHCFADAAKVCRDHWEGVVK